VLVASFPQRSEYQFHNIGQDPSWMANIRPNRSPKANETMLTESECSQELEIYRYYGFARSQRSEAICVVWIQ
jgi:hypothetical protein